MKILQIVPWVADEGLLAYERSFVPKDVDVIGLKEGSLGECRSDLARNLPLLVDTIQKAEKQGYNAVVLSCFADPGVEIARELVSIPVLGPLNVGLHVSQMIGHRTLLLFPEYARIQCLQKENVIIYGLQERVVARGTYRSVPEALKAYEDYKVTGKVNPFITEIVDISEKSIREIDIDVIVLGCGGMKWMKGVLESELAKRGYGITVINPLPLVVEMARVLVNLKLCHSKVGYPSPPKVLDRYKALGV